MSNFLLKLIKFGIGFVLFIPLYVGGSFYFPFIFPKIWLFQLVIEIIFFFYIILALLDARFRPRWSAVWTALFVLTAILVLTSFIGIDAFRSFWGNTERMSGVIAWLHFAAFAVILGSVLKSEKEWRNFFGLAVIVSILQFFYVLAQYFQLSLVWLPNSQVGTIGNADLLGLYTNFNIFFALYLWSSTLGGLRSASENRKFIHQGWGIFWALAFFINILTLYFDGSRGAILGFLAGIFIYFLLMIWRKGPAALKTWLPVIIILFFAYGVLWLARDTEFVQNNYQLGRITHISLRDTTIQQRFVEWNIAWDAFKARPIFGFGPNNYLYLHNAFLNPRVYNLQETNFDRAHNAYLDYASMSGILGLAAYIFFIAVLFFVFWKAGLYTWAALVAAYAVNSFFVFDHPSSFITLFLTIGFAAYTYNTQHETRNNEIQNPKSKIQNSSSSQIVAIMSILMSVLTVYLIWQVSWKPASANLNFTSAFTGLGAGILTPEQAFENYKQALKYETLGTSEFRNQYTQWIQSYINNFPPEKRFELFTFGINQLEQEAKDHPIVFVYLNLGHMYYFMAQGISNPDLKPELFAKAAEAYGRGIELAPKRLEVYYSYLQWALATKNYQKGVEMMRKTVEFAPDYPQNWWYLGMAYIAAGDEEVGMRSINRALARWLNAKEVDGRLDYNLDYILEHYSAFAPKQEILGVVNSYIKTQRWKELLLLYLGALASDPNDISIRQSLALVYQNLGLPDKVQQELQIIEKLKQK